MNRGHYFSDVFDGSTGIWWHCDGANITQISDLPKGVYYRESHKNTKKKKNRCQDQHMYSLLFISEKYITSEGEDNFTDQKWTNSEIEYDQFC